MSSAIALQDTMDQFILTRKQTESDEHVETCFELLAEYLLHYSDLFQEEYEEPDAEQLAAWEESLEEYVDQMINGDHEGAVELGSLPVDYFDPEHLRDFIGWFLLREPGIDSLELIAFGDILRDWLQFIHRKGWISDERHVLFTAVFKEMMPDAIRAVKAARLLLHYVRLGRGISPRMRGKRFSRFVEGHARVESLRKKQINLRFDNLDESIGPVMLPEEITKHLQLGDVLDIELGLREKHWVIVDIGPVYPFDIYMEADAYDIPEKLS